MASSLPNLPPGFDDMPVGDQLAYIGTLWDRVLEREADVPVPQSHLEELSRRLAEHEAGATDVRPWAEVEAELRAELAHRRASR